MEEKETISVIVYAHNGIYRHELPMFRLLNFNKPGTIFFPMNCATRRFYERNGDSNWEDLSELPDDIRRQLHL